MEKFTLNIYCQNKIGLISKTTLALTRRQINIESFNASETEVENVYKITIVVHGTKVILTKLVKQIEKLVEVYKVFLHENDEIVCREMALFKIGKDSNFISKKNDIIQSYFAKIAFETEDFVILERTGTPQDIDIMFNVLKQFHLIEFARGGRVAIVKWSKKFHQHLLNLSEEKEEIYE